jgi:hypothetical protein
MSATPPSDMHERTLTYLRERAANVDNEKPRAVLNHLLRALAKWRSALIVNTMLKRAGAVVQGGPFKGMKYIEQTTDGCLAARLLGSYEGELHSTIEKLIADRIETVINIGCAEGYYAVGLARRLPHAKIYAYDTDAAARQLCKSVAEANEVSNRVILGGEFAGKDFARFAGQKALVICDIEGGEATLLDPVAYPALRSFHIISECHALPDRSLTHRQVADLVKERFLATHSVSYITHAVKAVELPAWLGEETHIDMLLSLWEWRTTPTPWLVMHPRPA